MTREDTEHLFLELNSVLVKFWKDNGRPEKEVKIELLERMLHWYKNMGYVTLDKQETANIPEGLDEAAEKYKELRTKGYAEHAFDSALLFPNDLSRAFKAGAEWRDAQLLKLPKELDEAAWRYVKNKYGISDPQKVFENEQIAEDFKAGAEWAFGQGHTFTQPVFTNGMGQAYIPFKFVYFESEVKEGEEVIVQIRKK